MIKEWLVKGAKEEEERTLGINTAGSSKLKEKQVIRSPSTTLPKASSDMEIGSGRRVSSECTIDAFYVVSTNHFVQLVFFFWRFLGIRCEREGAWDEYTGDLRRCRRTLPVFRAVGTWAG